MIPHELKSRKIKFPETNDYSVVLITGGELRHQRFAYRIQKEFGDLVLAWYQVESIPMLGNTGSLKEKLAILYHKAKDRLLAGYGSEDIKNYVRSEGLVKSVGRAFSSVRDLMDTVYLQRKIMRNQISCEKKLFKQEIDELKQRAKLKPVLIKDPNSREFIQCIKELSPYFFLSLGGALYGKELLESIRGVAINQHAGWSPTYKGAGTTEWALYHRNLDYVGSTIHVITTGVDAGPILRRSHPCLVNNDTPESCFLRVVALGTELMIEVVREIIANKEVLVYDQPADVGKTYLGSQLDRSTISAIYRDFSHNWLEKEFSRLRRF